MLAFCSTYFYTFTLSGVYGILDVAICHLAGLVLPHFLRSKLGNLGFLEEAVEDLVAQLFRALGKLIEILQCIEPLLVERIQFFQGFVELGNLYINILEFVVKYFVGSSVAQLHMMADFLLVECVLVHAEVEQGYGIDMIEFEIPVISLGCLLTDREG